MRQAGRYLPEFRKIRSKNKDFIKLCLNSELSSTITLQPIERFKIDSAIIFSDILIVPYALGQKVNFIKNEGPYLSEINLNTFFNTSEDDFITKLQPVYSAISKTRKKLSKEKSLIGFVGAPWTLIFYMYNLKKEKKLNYLFQNLQKSRILEKLINFLCIHIKKQVEAGADVIQIFDSWASLIPEDKLAAFCYNPNYQLTRFCKEHKIPVICFPKGLRKNYLNFKNEVKPDCLSLDYTLDVSWAKENLNDTVLQGGMDPNYVLKSDTEMFNETKKYLDAFRDVPYIYNLGHGLLPKTDPLKLEKLIEFVKGY